MLKLTRIYTVAALLIPRILARQSKLTNVDDSVHPTWLDKYDQQWDLTYSGPLSFEHLPYTRCLVDNSAQFDIAILGMPFDNKVTFRTGARFGPYGIRSGSRSQDYTKGYSYSWGYSPYENITVLDCGDVPMNPFDTALAIDQADLAYYTLLSRELPKNQQSTSHTHPRIMTFGGDHTIVLPILRALKRAYKEKITVIHFDAHPDTWTPESITDIPTPTIESELNHGTFFDRAFNESLMTGNNIHAGLRTKIVKSDLEHDEDIGFTYIPTDYMDSWGAESIAEHIKATVQQSGDDAPVYLSIDIDILDPGFAPGTGTPEAGGWTMREMKRVLRRLAGLNIVGADIVEVSPPFDHAEITTVAAAELARDLLYLLRGDIKHAMPPTPPHAPPHHAPARDEL